MSEHERDLEHRIEEREDAEYRRTESPRHLKSEREQRRRYAEARMRAGMYTDDIDAVRAERRAWVEWQEDREADEREEELGI